MEARYSRNIPSLSEQECALLRQKRVLILGCGGLGGHLVDMLLRLGMGSLRVCDGDVFDETNLNRQLLSERALLGVNKARAAAIHAEAVNPNVTVEVVDTPMTRENVDALVSGCDAVLDALDNIESRRILSRACAQAGIPYVFGAVGGWVAQAGVSMPADHLIDILYPRGTVVRDKSVLSFTPALCASVQAALCVKLLVGRTVETGKLYCFDLLNQEFETVSMT